MPNFTRNEKEYIKEYVILDLTDRIGIAGTSIYENELLRSIAAKLKEMCDA